MYMMCITLFELSKLCRVFKNIIYECLQCADVDCRHAVIEYDNVDNYFTIQDLNTVRGTCVNNCHIQDAKVRLVSGDIIQIGFGPSAVQYTFCQSDESPVRSIHLFKIMNQFLFYC